MILTCPACSTRYQADEAKFPPQGRSVRCAKCGHVWHQPGSQPESQSVTPEAAAADSTGTSAPASSAPAAEASETENESFSSFHHQATPAPAPASKLAMLAVAAGWIGLILVVLLIGYAAVRYRQEIALLWPQSASVYERLGMKVNAQGLDFIGVNYHRESEDGQLVLAVTGQIVNSSGRELPVPQSVRVSLADSANRELYHWSFTPPVQSLKPGQSAPFTTRLSSPPADARHLEVRFAPPGN